MPAKEEDESTLKEEVNAPEPEKNGSQVAKPEREKDLYTWKAAVRPFKKRDREFWVTAAAIAGVVGLVLFLVEGFMPVLLVISVAFLFYVMSTVPPEDVEYRITNLGIRVGGRLTSWDVMNRFWFIKRFDSDLLIVETVTLPGRMEYVMDPDKKLEIKDVILKHIPYEDVPASGLDRAAKWFSGKMPSN